MIAAAVLRTWLTNQRLQSNLICVFQSEFGAELCELPRLKKCDTVTMVHSQWASGCTLITKQYLGADAMQSMSCFTLMATSRRLFFRLINWAGMRGSGRASSRASSIATSINDDISDPEEPGSN